MSVDTLLSDTTLRDPVKDKYLHVPNWVPTVQLNASIACPFTAHCVYVDLNQPHTMNQREMNTWNINGKLSHVLMVTGWESDVVELTSRLLVTNELP